jgi:hypothetical protein
MEEMWIAPDGSGRQVRQAEQPWFSTAKSRRAWEKQGRPSLGAGHGDTRFGRGELSLEPDADTLPTDPTRLHRELQEYAGGNNDVLTDLEVGAGVLAQQPIRPLLRSALLRILADTDELGYAGTVKDRAGRTGAAFVFSQKRGGRLPERDIVIFDRRTGMLLSREEITMDAGRLPVRTPAVTEYDLYLRAARVDDSNQRP